MLRRLERYGAINESTLFALKERALDRDPALLRAFRRYLLYNDKVRRMCLPELT